LSPARVMSLISTNMIINYNYNFEKLQPKTTAYPRVGA
jgi:hypothetical protein